MDPWGQPSYGLPGYSLQPPLYPMTGPPHGHGHGRVHGHPHVQGYGHGQGSGHGHGYGLGHGYGQGYGHGHGYGLGHGYGHGHAGQHIPQYGHHAPPERMHFSGPSTQMYPGHPSNRPATETRFHNPRGPMHNGHRHQFIQPSVVPQPLLNCGAPSQIGFGRPAIPPLLQPRMQITGVPAHANFSNPHSQAGAQCRMQHARGPHHMMAHDPVSRTGHDHQSSQPRLQITGAPSRTIFSMPVAQPSMPPRFQYAGSSSVPAASAPSVLRANSPAKEHENTREKCSPCVTSAGVVTQASASLPNESALGKSLPATVSSESATGPIQTEAQPTLASKNSSAPDSSQPSSSRSNSTSFRIPHSNNPSQKPKIILCVECNKPARFVSRQCSVLAYCSATCTQTHWPVHRVDCDICKPPQLKKDPIPNNPTVDSQNSPGLRSEGLVAENNPEESKIEHLTFKNPNQPTAPIRVAKPKFGIPLQELRRNILACESANSSRNSRFFTENPRDENLAADLSKLNLSGPFKPEMNNFHGGRHS